MTPIISSTLYESANSNISHGIEPFDYFLEKAHEKEKNK